MSAKFDFSGKRVFVFGGTSGINLGIARCFARAGADVAVASRSQDKVDSAVAELNDLGSDSRGYSLDHHQSSELLQLVLNHQTLIAQLVLL